MLVEIPALLSAKKLADISAILDKATFVDGKLSAGSAAARVKQNEEIPSDAAHWQQLNNLVMAPLVAHPIFQHAVLPHRVASAFFARYNNGQHYGEHIDDPVMGPQGGRYRCDVSFTVFLNSPEEYTGGELRIRTAYGHQDIKLDAGHVIIYPASSLHQVLPVTGGERRVAVSWAQSLIRDAAQRELLYELHRARETLMMKQPDAEVTRQVDHSYVNLVRMWSEL